MNRPIWHVESTGVIHFTVAPLAVEIYSKMSPISPQICDSQAGLLTWCSHTLFSQPHLNFTGVFTYSWLAPNFRLTESARPHGFECIRKGLGDFEGDSRTFRVPTWVHSLNHDFPDLKLVFIEIGWALAPQTTIRSSLGVITRPIQCGESPGTTHFAVSALVESLWSLAWPLTVIFNPVKQYLNLQLEPRSGCFPGLFDALNPMVASIFR